jgi:hypothetical protein
LEREEDTMDGKQMNISQALRAYAEKYLEVGLEQEISRARRYGRDLTLLVIVPRFSGEVSPDEKAEVIRELTECARGITRNVDTGLSLPWGVLLVLPETNEEGARVVEEKMRARAGALTFQGPAGPYTPDIRSALAVWPKDGQTRKDLLDHLKTQLQEHR